MFVAQSAWHGEHSSLDRRIMEAWPAGPLSRTLVLGNAFRRVARRVDDGWRGKWRCLRHGDALALMQWLLCRTKTPCGSDPFNLLADPAKEASFVLRKLLRWYNLDLVHGGNSNRFSTSEIT